MLRRIQHGPIAAASWDPHLYLKFSNQRLRPALELLDRVPLESPAVIYDLGCGSGQVTRIISERWPCARVYGLDSSKEMLEEAAKTPGNVRWTKADLRSWRPDPPPDLIYSNATLHWVEAHHDLFPRLVGFLKSGGCLAAQMPLSWQAPSHRLMRETLANGAPGGKVLGTEKLRQAMARSWVEDAEVYYGFLAGCTRSLDIWETLYMQVLEGEDPVLEWVKGTGLRPILDGLDEKEREIFLVQYARRLRAAYPVRSNGRTLYPLRRLFMVARV